MKQKKKNKIDFDSDKKAIYIKEIIGFFHTERGEEIGIIAAEHVLDFFLQTVGEEIYQRAITDAKMVLKEKLESLEIELDILSAG